MEKEAGAASSAEAVQRLSVSWLYPAKIGCKTQSSLPPQTLFVVLPFKPVTCQNVQPRVLILEITGLTCHRNVLFGGVFGSVHLNHQD